VNGAPAERVACLAFDSPGVRLLRAGLDAGRLPTLAGLLARGRSVSLADRQEIATPTSWPTLLRGCEFPQHGLSADRAFAPGEYRIDDVPPEAAAVPPFWRHLSDAGLRSVVLSAYSSPLLDGFNGLQVNGWGSHDPFDAKLGRFRSDPPELLGELDALVGPRTLRWDGTPPRGARAVRKYVEDMVHGCEQQARAALRMLDSGDWRFAFASFPECHQAGHWLWHHADPGDPGHEPDAPADVRDGLLRIYEATDAAIGSVIAALPPGTVVLVISPYDMGPNHHLDEVLPAVLEHAGWMVRPSSAQLDARTRVLRAGRRAVRAAVPLALRPALGRIAGRDRLLAELAASAVDWSSTRAVPVPSDGSSGLRLNLVGREPEGTVQPGADAERALVALAELMGDLRCADTGRTLVARMARYEELFDAEPLTGPADLFVQWERITRPRAVRSEGTGEIAVPAERSIRSVHYAPGFVVAAGPGIEPSGEGLVHGSAEARLQDLGATVLALLGVEAPAAITGRPIAELVPAGAEAGG
jgi:predicted AlkP superfamily phosphohydrolase/phosphomutase